MMTAVDPPTVENLPTVISIADVADRLRAAGYTVTPLPGGFPTVYADLAVGKRRCEVVIVRGAYQRVVESNRAKRAVEKWPSTIGDAVDLAVKASGEMGWIAPVVEADEQPPVIGDVLAAEAGQDEADHAGEVAEDLAVEAGAA